MRNVAAWDGTSWDSLGPGLNGELRALFAWGDTLLAGGEFRMDDGFYNSFPIALWDGQVWKDFGGGLSGRVDVFTVHEGRLVAGGRVWLPGNRQRSVVALSETSWVSLGQAPEGEIEELLVHDGMLVAAGSFQYAGDLPVDGIAGWDGSQWVALLGDSTTPRGVSALAEHEGALIAAGASLARWDGVAWTTLGSAPGSSGRVTSLVSFGGRLVASSGGYDSAEAVWEWMGTDWRTLGSGPFAYVRTLVEHEGHLFAGGDFSSRGLVDIAEWDGGSWSCPVPGPLRGRGLVGSGGVTTMATVGQDLVVAGRFNAAGDERGWISLRDVARWDGTSWSPMDAGLQGNVTTLVPSPAGLLAGGWFYDGFEGGSVVAKWDGSSWRPVGSLSGWSQSLADCQGRLFAAGYFYRENGTRPTLVQWNGLAWVDVPGSNPEDPYALLLADGERLVTVERYRSTKVRILDGSRWTELGEVEGFVSYAALWRGRIVIGGSFAHAGHRAPLLLWNGQEWDDIAPEWEGSVAALGIHGGDLVVSGSFYREGDSVEAFVMRWDGRTWCVMGEDGSGSRIHAFASLADHLYAGGLFSSVAGQGSFMVARWDGTPSPMPPTPVATALAPGRPNPFLSEASFAFGLPLSARIELSVADVAGRRVRTIVSGTFEAGSYSRTWDGRSDEGRRLKSGVYFVRLVTGGRLAGSRKIVLLD